MTPTSTTGRFNLKMKILYKNNSGMTCKNKKIVFTTKNLLIFYKK